MANNIPNCAIPFYNIQQYIINARGHSLRTSADISIPKYISDKRVLAGINYANLPYLYGLSNLEPSYPERYYYSEITTCIDPIIQKIYISPWIGYSLTYKRPKVTEMLLSSGLDIYQRMIIIEHKHFKKGLRNIYIQEIPCIAQLYIHLESPEYEEMKSVFKSVVLNNVNLAKPIEVRSQMLDQISIVSNEAYCYRDIWDYINSKISKLPAQMKADREKFIEDIKDFIKRETDKMLSEKN